MIYYKKNNIIRRFFSLYLPWIIRRNFREVKFDPIAVDPGKSLLVLSNHFSWWDAFLMYYVFKQVTGKKLHVMVLEETIKKRFFMKYIGAFSVHKHSRDVFDALNYAAELLNDPNNLVLLFPQGKLQSNFVDEIAFEKGAIYIMDKAEGKFQLIYSAMFTENFQHKKPSVHVYLSLVTNKVFNNISVLTDSYQQHYNNARELQTQKTVL